MLAWGDMVAYEAPYSPAGLPRAQAVCDLAASIAADVYLGLGDISNDSGSDANYVQVASTLAGVKDRMRAVPGNHDYAAADGSAYFAYFKANCGAPGKGWYSFDLPNNWHLIGLNSCSVDVAHGVGVDGASEQGLWLAADLAANAGKHILAYFHHPARTSGFFGGQANLWQSPGTFWHQLYQAGAEIIVNGHAHVYERFARQDWNGNADNAGIRQFTVGCGGAGNVGVGTVPPNLESVMRTDTPPVSTTYGLLKLTLGAGYYGWEYVAAAGYDGGLRDKGACLTHGATYPAEWITPDNTGTYLSGGVPNAVGSAYLGTRLAHAIAAPATGLGF